MVSFFPIANWGCRVRFSIYPKFDILLDNKLYLKENEDLFIKGRSIMVVYSIPNRFVEVRFLSSLYNYNFNYKKVMMINNLPCQILKIICKICQVEV